jgi:serine/threonine protein kinase
MYDIRRSASLSRSTGEGTAASRSRSPGEGTAASRSRSPGEGTAASRSRSPGEGAAASRSRSPGEGAAAGGGASSRSRSPGEGAAAGGGASSRSRSTAEWSAAGAAGAAGGGASRSRYSTDRSASIGAGSMKRSSLHLPPLRGSSVVANESTMMAIRKRDIAALNVPAYNPIDVWSASELCDVYAISRRTSDVALFGARFRPFLHEGFGVAIKLCRSNSLIDNEVNIMRSMQRHVNICPLLNLFESSYADVLESMSYKTEADRVVVSGILPHSDLKTKLMIMPLLSELHMSSKMDTNVVRGMWIQVMDALCYLNVQGVVHGDLHRGNIMVNRMGSLVIIDFGISSRPQLSDWTLVRKSTSSQYRGHPTYMCPEALDAEARGSKFVPMAGQSAWEMGTLMFMLANHGNVPYPMYPSSKTWYDTRHQIREDAPFYTMDAFEQSCVMELLARHVVDRPTVHDIRMRLMHFWAINALRRQSERMAHIIDTNKKLHEQYIREATDDDDRRERIKITQADSYESLADEVVIETGWYDLVRAAEKFCLSTREP